MKLSDATALALGTVLLAGSVRAEESSTATSRSPDTARPASDDTSRDASMSRDASASGGSAIARAYYERGVSLALDKKFADAQAAFERAVEDDPPPEAYFGLGQVELALGRPCQAVDAYQRYLHVGGARIPNEKRQAVEQHVLELRRAGASDAVCHPTPGPGNLYLQCEEPGARASVDGKAIDEATSQPLVVEPGLHTVGFSTFGSKWSPVDVQVPADGSVFVQCALAAPSGTVERAPMSGVRIAGWTTLGVGLGLSVATLSHFFYNHGRHEVWAQNDARLRAGQGTDQEVNDHNDLRTSIQRASRVTVGLAIASGVLTTAGVVLLVLDSSADRTHHAQKMQAGKTSLAGRLGLTESRISADFSPAQLGLSWSGTF